MPSREQPASDAVRSALRWAGPLAALLVFVAVILVLHRQLAQLHVHSIFRHLRAIPRSQIAAAFGFTALSYWLLSTYELLALRYLLRPVAYARIVFTSFIAYSFAHTLGFAAFTGAAIRFRLYGGVGIRALEVATISAFCSLSLGLGLATLSGISLLADPAHAARIAHLDPRWAMAVGCLLLAAVAAYALWACFGRGTLELRGWALRPPGPRIAAPQLVLGCLDLTLAGAVLYALLPAGAPVHFLTFLGAYAAAVIAGIISHVPGGVGVFELVIISTVPAVPPDALLGSMLAYRAIYYLVPLLAGALLFAYKELAGQRAALARAHALASMYIAPVVPQVAGGLTFVAGAVLLISGATPALDERLGLLARFLPLAVLEVSHLAGSVIGVGLLVLSRALFRRVQAAYQVSFWLLVAGICVSLLKGLDFEEALVLALVLGVLSLGSRAFYRPTAILSERFSPTWVASIAGVVILAIWIGLISAHHVEYSRDLWWTFAIDKHAPRMLRASLAVTVIATGYLLLNLLRPARPEPALAGSEELDKARRVIASSDLTLANAALMGDKRLLFSDAGDAFVMYQVARRSWVALGDPVGARAAAEELVWRLRELSDRHGGEVVFYQVSGERLSLYVDLGLAALKIGEEARVPLEGFSLEGPRRAELRQTHRRVQREGAKFEIVPPESLDALLPDLERISAAWLAAKSTAEKGFSVGAFVPQYLRNFPIALVRHDGLPVAFANVWITHSREELSVDLMRFTAEAPNGSMDFLFIELMLWGKAHGYRWFNLGMAPLAGLESHPLAPAWHRVGNFVFRHGEHFYNFEGLRRYKAKFAPEWDAKYLVARGGLSLPRVLVDVSVLIAGGVKELFTG